MIDKIRLIARTKNYFTYLLPVFFVIHGYTYNYDLIKVSTALWVVAGFLLFAFLLYRLGLWLLKDRYKAHIFAFTILFVNFFFGYLYDNLNNKISKKAFFSQYPFLIFFVGVLVLIVFIILKKKKTVSRKLGMVFNIFLLCLLLVEFAFLGFELLSPIKFHLQLNTSTLTPCDTCKKPDIYLILTDGYAGPAESKDILHYDDSAFHKAIAERKFHFIEDSYSNYNYTMLSMASTLNMSYLNIDPKGDNRNTSGSMKAIKKNQFTEYMRSNGYTIVNNSIFQLTGGDREPVIFFPEGTSLLLESTLGYHLFRIVQFKLYGNNNLRIIRDNQLATVRKSNNLLFDKTIEAAKTKSKQPRFVYCHLVMPHFPYFFDKDGNATGPETFEVKNNGSKSDYLQYMQYSGKRIIALVDSIQRYSATPPIIFLMSDHGFREMEEKIDHKYYFSNISAVYRPDGDYSKYYRGMSNVNVFRTLLNTQFNQKMEILKDSMVYYDVEAHHR